ncbi:MAG: GNAT family N-acetyltransferase [Sulfitobacter sp.]
MLPANFDPQPILMGDTLSLRPLCEADRAGLYDVASNPAVWAGHPAKDRHERPVFDPYFDMLLASGTTLVVSEQATEQIIGCSRYYAAPDHSGSVSIGYTFLGQDWWGGAANFAMKSLMLAHAFKTVDTVWLHINLNNIRSQRATAKLGAVHAYDGALTMGGKSGIWQCWRLEKSAWDRVVATRQS